MLRPVIFALLCAALLEGTAAAQNDSPLVAEDLEIVEGVGIYGEPILTAEGVLINTDEDNAYANISLRVEAYDAADELVGEGFGVLVNACGAGLLFDFALQPEHAQRLSAPIELFESDAEIDRLAVLAVGEAVEPRALPDLPDGVTQISDAEVVEVEWIDENSLRFGVGCHRDLFSQWAWFDYTLGDENATPGEHPFADAVTDQLRETIGLDEELFARSFLRFAPDGDRIIYQDAINDLWTAAVDGRFVRLLYNDQHNRTLQVVYWQPEERFIAAYYGAYGDPVHYVTADAEARRISPAINRNPASVITPGITRDARRVVLAGTFEDVTGYYLYVVNNNFFERLFEAEPPGNNYPAPLPLVNPADDLVSRIYVALDVEGESRLQCFNREEGVVHDLAPLPFNLAQDERAAWWLSPDDQTIALAANGVHGGLWTIDLTSLPSCEGA